MDLDRFRPAFASDDSVRFCGLRLETLKKALSEPKVVDALVFKGLEVPGKAAFLKGLSGPEKLAAIENRIEAIRSSPTSMWYEAHPVEILAAHLWPEDSGLGKRFVEQLFFDVRKEAALGPPVAALLRGKGFEVFAEVPLGRCRVDVLGYKQGSFFTPKRAVGVELKNEHEQVKRGLDQMAVYRDYCQVVYLACTPYLIAEQLDRHAAGRGVQRWDADVFYRRIRELGFGLLIVEGQTVYEFISPQEGSPSNQKLDELVGVLKLAKRM